MKKISVMIVDDEKLVLEDLATIVDWEGHGFEIVATAVNGKQALSKFQQYRPQVVFTDIKMPFMDGIELIEHLRARDKQTQIVVLTAYEDFTYAKSAIRHGIMDYVIKSTIDGPMASNLLGRIRTLIENQGQVLDILKEKQISDFFYADDQVPVSEKEIFHKPYCYLLIEQNMPLNLPGDYSIDSIRFRKADAISVLLEGDSPDYKIVAVSNTPREQILLVLDIQKCSQKDLQQIVYQCALEKKKKLQEQLQTELSVYMVCCKMSLIELKRFYRSKSQYFYQKYLVDDREVYDFLDSHKPISLSTDEVMLDTKRIDACIEELDDHRMKKYLEELFSTIDTYKKLSTLSRELYDLMKRYYKQLPSYNSGQDISFENNWTCWLNANRLKNWFIDGYTELIKDKKSSYQNQYSKVIAQVIEYIYRHYSNCDLTLNAIADEVQLSVGYLCVLFKKETGKTLNNFISEVRITQAKKLLYENKLKVYEISTAVGFQSSQYFSQVFYKQVGVYPNEFQKGKCKTQELTTKEPW